jgi:hypothetical protein
MPAPLCARAGIGRGFHADAYQWQTSTQIAAVDLLACGRDDSAASGDPESDASSSHSSADDCAGRSATCRWPDRRPAAHAERRPGPHRDAEASIDRRPMPSGIDQSYVWSEIVKLSLSIAAAAL